MKRAFFKSIRFQIILLYIFILALTLTILRGMIYVEFRHNSQVDLDTKTRLKADGLEKAIRTYWQTKKLETTKEWDSSFLFFKKEDRGFEQIANQLTGEKIAAEFDMTDVSLIFDANGNLVASSQPVYDINPLKQKVISSVIVKNAIFNTDYINIDNGRHIPVRIFSKPIVEKDKVQYVVQVVVSLIPLNKSLAQLKRAFFLQVPLILLIAISGALFLVKVTLSPVDGIVNTVGKINSDTLKIRIKVPNTGDEIARLAETFNAVLEELDKSFSSQRQIVQDISHELKTPLTILQGQQEVGLRRDRPVDEYKDILSSNLQEIERMKRIVNNLLLLAKFDKKGLLIEMSKFNLNDFIYKIVEEMNVLAQDKQITLKIIEHDQKIFIRGNDIHSHLLFRNILENAIKYTSSGGSVTIELKRLKPFANIDIIDTGIGISPEHLPHIFDRFYRVDKVRSSGEGFGLGLSIAQSILELYKGDIGVQSQAHQGTTFTIRLPLSS